VSKHTFESYSYSNQPNGDLAPFFPHLSQPDPLIACIPHSYFWIPPIPSAAHATTTIAQQRAKLITARIEFLFLTSP
jgi:hypothetical protein